MASPAARMQRLADKSPQAQSAAALQRQAPDTLQPIQRIVVQSDWLKMGEDADSGKIFTGKSYAGPWTQCTDTTNKGYRDEAESALGNLKPFLELSRYGVLPAGIDTSGPFKKAHLIAAEFGGQLKFRPPANIRYHAAQLEYGDWQKSETDVKKDGKVGYITAMSAEGVSDPPRRVARDVIDIIRADLHEDDVDGITGALAGLLSGASFVPIAVDFDYTDVQDTGASFKRSWGHQDANLTVNKGVPKNQALLALRDAGLGLPKYLQADDSAQKFTVANRGDLVGFLRALSLDPKQLPKVVAKVNAALKVVAAQGAGVHENIAGSINKHVFVADTKKSMAFADSFVATGVAPITVAEV